MIKLLQKLGRRPLRENWLMIKVSWVLLCIHLSLRLLPFHSIYRFVNRSPRSLPPGELIDKAKMDQLIWAITRGGRYFLGSDSCLRQALAGQYFLSRAGVPVNLRIGVKRNSDGSLLAHAWIEKDGQILIGGSDETIQRFLQLPDLDQVVCQEQPDHRR